MHPQQLADKLKKDPQGAANWHSALLHIISKFLLLQVSFWYSYLTSRLLQEYVVQYLSVAKN